MKLKTFCFNTTIFKKNFTHFWPIWLLYLCYLIVTVPVSIWIQAMNMLSWGYSVEEMQYDALGGVLEYGIHATPYFLFAIVTVMAIFSYLYTAKNANMIHALPVNRCELFLTNYCSGLLFLILPEIITFVAGVFVCLACKITCIQYLFTWLLYTAGISFFGYSLAVFCAMVTGQLFALPIYYGIVNFMYIGVRYIVSLIINLICYGITEGWRPGYSGLLSPWYFLETHLSLTYQYTENTSQVMGIEIVGLRYIGIYAIVAVICVILAIVLYKRRQIETAGDMVSVKWIEPIFRWGVALCGGSMLAVFLTEMFSSVKNLSVFGCVILSMIFFGFICFFAAEMLLRKSFRVVCKKRLIEWGVFSACAVCILLTFRLDVFGVEQKIPASEDIKEAFIYMDYAMDYVGDDIELVKEIHQKLIDAKEDYQYMQGPDCSTVTIKYILNDGETLVRCYTIPIDEETLSDSSSPTTLIREQEQIPERQIQSIFGINYEENEYVSGQIDVYDQDGNCKNYVMDKNEIQTIVDAYMQDAKDGKLDFLIYPYDEEEIGEYYNNINVTFYNTKSIATPTDYYYYYTNFNYYYNSSTGNAYLTISKNCTNTIAALEEMGILNEEWKLYTYKEYDTLVNGAQDTDATY